MPRKLTVAEKELREQIKALEAAIKADRAAQADAERPLRQARAKLAQRLSGFQSTLTRATARLSKALHKEGYYGTRYMSATPERELQEARKRFDSALVDLQTFDALHGVEGAEYPTAPTIDGEAITAQGRAEREAELARFKPAIPRVDERDALLDKMRCIPNLTTTLALKQELVRLGIAANDGLNLNIYK